MALIAPTVDTLGDAALTNSIIDKSLTEFQDELVTEIREHAFYNCAALKKAVFGSVSDVADRAFDGCTALTTVDFHTSTPIGDYAFNNCSALTALILRGATVCHAVSGTLQNSGIASGNGYIYVPAALVDAYKAASNWKTYAAQIRAIEDYPEVCDPYNWEAVAKNIELSTYKDVYKIGDEVPVDLGSEGIINMQIAAFDVDTLADGTGTAAISWVAKNLLGTKRRMNPARVVNDDGSYQEGTGAIGGWEKCEMRAYLNNIIKPLIPELVRNNIVAVQRSQTAYTTANKSTTQTTEDELWLPGFNSTSTALEYSTSRLKYNAVTGDAAAWFSRTASSSTQFRICTQNGSVSTSPSGTEYNICLGFCTGRTPT